MRVCRPLVSWLPALAALAATGCGDDAPASLDAGPPDARPDECEGFVVPARPDTSTCDDDAVAAATPDTLVTCARGSGHPGRWTVDGDGLPAYDFGIEQRCDPAGRHWSPRQIPQRDPIHLIGNGRGLQAMAHASGGVEIYSQDRGHKWLNHVDPGPDPGLPAWRPQQGSTSYVGVAGGPLRSTRFEDLPVGEAIARQARRFGVGYVEIDTRFDDVRVVRRVFAPDAEARALVAEVSLVNSGSAPVTYDLVELWDVNLHQIPVAIVTSDLLAPSITEVLDRSRRELNARFTHTVSWDADARVGLVTTTANPGTLPASVVDRASPAEVDGFPDPMFLAVLDDGPAPDAVWLRDDEFGDATLGAGSRTLAVPGEHQPALLALRVPVTVPAGTRVTRRFAFGYVPGGGAPDAAVAELRARGATLFDETQASWRERLVWAAFPGLAGAGVVQRELAWASYSALAHVVADEYHGRRVLGQGGAYKYIHGLDGAIGDLALFAEAMLLVDPAVARDTLAYAMATQHAESGLTPFRYPYATTGVGSFSDVGIYDQRSDAYYLVPAQVARYVATTRDDAFLAEDIPYWPRSAGESGTVVAHARDALVYAEGTLGLGARGLVAMGTGDYADGVTNLTDEPSTPRGSSSSYNAGFVVLGFPLAADVFEATDATLAADLRALAASQAAALEAEAWDGMWYLRGFVDSGNPLAPDILFLEPQLFPVLAGLVDDVRRAALLEVIALHLESAIGALSNIALDPLDPAGGIDQPQIGGTWPVANAWLTEAYARHDAALGWSSFTRNLLAAHAEAYPDLWYGIWTGPDSWNGPDHERAGEADAHLATALTDYPAANAHMHTGPLRALQGLLGIAGTRDGLRIFPRVPTETFTVVFPRLRLESAPDRIALVAIFSGGGPVTFEVRLPTGLRGLPAGGVQVTVDDTPVASTVDGELVSFVTPAVAGSSLSVVIAATP